MAITSLFTDEDKKEVNGIFDLLHDTFAKTITVYHDAKKTITKDVGFNSVYGTVGSTESISYETVSYTVEARIRFDRVLAEQNFPEAGSALRLDKPAGEAKVTVKLVDYNKINGAKRVEYLGKKYHIVTDFRPQGFFDTRYYSFFIKPVE
jgi:hypothetical protein